MSNSSTPDNPASTFFADLNALRNKYPMVFIDAWTPADYVQAASGDDVDPDEPPTIDWNDHDHRVTADILYDRFDANIGMNWEIVRDAVTD